MKVVFPVSNSDEFIFWCHGCGFAHHIDLKRWIFNGDLEKPAVFPSILQPGDNSPRCHVFVRNGQIQYLADCAHKFAGQTVDMIPPPGW